jgi:hypothetical protein
MTTDLRLNRRLRESLPNIMKAKKKPIRRSPEVAASNDAPPRSDQDRGTNNPSGVKVKTVANLVDAPRTGRSAMTTPHRRA